MPSISRLDLAQVEIPASHPAAVLGRSVPVHGFLIGLGDQRSELVLLTDTDRATMTGLWGVIDGRPFR